MKKDLVTSIGLAVICLTIAYFVSNMFIGPIEDKTVKTIDSSVDTTLVDPSPEVFNYKALNPTVEVYIGDCTEFDSNGICIESNGDNQGNP